MPRSEEMFAQLLTEGIYHIRLREQKTIQIIQDELGYALGREGGTSIEYWRKGHLPSHLSDVEQLAREIVQRGRVEQLWLEQFLAYADHPQPVRLVEALFGSAPRLTLPDNNSRPQALPLESPFDPFVVGPPVVQPYHFFGREYELKRIFGLWRRLPLQNVALVGRKRSGKTSLLHYLKSITRATPAQLRPNQRTDWLPDPDQYDWVFVDFQDARMCRLERLLHYLLTCLALPVPEPCDLEGFLDVVSDHLARPAIILMDEIQAALASPELNQQFWGSLRSLGCNLTGGKLAFLLTSHELPAQLAGEYGKPSPFFNIFGHTFTLGALTEAEARELVASSPRPFAPQDVNWILGQSGCWPFLLQILCHARLTALEYGETDESWKREAMLQMAPYLYLLS